MVIDGYMLNFKETNVFMRMVVRGATLKLEKEIGLSPDGYTVQVSNLDPLTELVIMMASLGWFDGGDRKFEMPIEKALVTVDENKLDIVIRLVLCEPTHCTPEPTFYIS